MGQAPCSEYQVASQRVISAWPASTMLCNASSCRSRSNVWPRTSPQACSRTMRVPPDSRTRHRSQKTQIMDNRTQLSYRSLPFFRRSDNPDYSPTIGLFGVQIIQISRINRQNARLFIVSMCQSVPACLFERVRASRYKVCHRADR